MAPPISRVPAAPEYPRTASLNSTVKASPIAGSVPPLDELKTNDFALDFGILGQCADQSQGLRLMPPTSRSARSSCGGVLKRITSSTSRTFMIPRVKTSFTIRLWAKRLCMIGAILGIVDLATSGTFADASSNALANARATSADRPASTSGTPSQILAEAQRATLAARSVTLTERVVENGIHLSAKLEGRWPNRIRISVAAGRLVEVIVIASSSVYVDANAVAWASEYKLSSTGAAELSGRWFVTTASDPELGATPLSTFNPKVVERPVFDELKSRAADLKEQLSRFDGHSAVELSDASGAIYISSTGKPYILRIITNRPTIHGFLDFSSFNSSTNFAVPNTASNLDAALAEAQSATTS